MAKYTHIITVPVTTSVNVIVESDDKVKDAKHAYQMAMEKITSAGTWYDLENKPGFRGAVELGEELSYHTYLNRGNVCEAACSEIDWDTEEQ